MATPKRPPFQIVRQSLETKSEEVVATLSVRHTRARRAFRRLRRTLSRQGHQLYLRGHFPEPRKIEDPAVIAARSLLSAARAVERRKLYGGLSVTCLIEERCWFGRA